MSEITASKTVLISDLASEISTFKHNPSLIKRSVLSCLSEISSDTVNIVDPTNPLMFLLSVGVANTAANVTESMLLLQKQYPVIATNEEELYLHMSDKDYLDRFASPSSGVFTFIFQYQTLLSNLVYDPIDNCRRARLAANTEIKVADTCFTLQYPIDFRVYDKSVLIVSYDASNVSPLQTLKTNLIEYTIDKDNFGVEWLKFSINVEQLYISATHYPVENIRLFKEDIALTDQFNYARVFYQTSPEQAWIELNTSHTEQVYDPYKPTAILRVTESNLAVFIPNIYIQNNTVRGLVRVDVYETKGAINLDLSSYTIGSYVVSRKSTHPDTENLAYHSAMNAVSFYVFSGTVISGGSDKLSFTALRERVIKNAVGNIDIPITPNALQAKIEKEFTLIKNVDIITDRIYLAGRDLPPPSNDNLVLPATITIDTLSVKIDDVKTHPKVFDNGLRTTLSSNLIYQSNNGVLSIVDDGTINLLANMRPGLLAEVVNEQELLYSPFHYVLDTSNNEFEMRSYYLDSPKVTNIGFIDQNTSNALKVNTDGFNITKHSSGYYIDVSVKSDTAYKALPDASVHAQLGAMPVGESSPVYLNATILGKNSLGERVFRFNLQSNFDVDAENNLIFNNFKMFTAQPIDTSFNLSTKFSLFYITDAVAVGYVAQSMDVLIGKQFLPTNATGITQEELSVVFGSYLKNLWTQVRSTKSSGVYQTYPSDVLATYTEDVYDKDPITGAIFTVVNGEIVYNRLHLTGEPILDASGNATYKHRQGDIVYDQNNSPIPLAPGAVTRHIDLLLVEGLYYFCTDRSYINYRTEISQTLENWINVSLEEITDSLLEKTRIYYYPKRSIGTIQVSLGNGVKTTLPANQSLVVDIYLKPNVSRNEKTESEIERATTIVINRALMSEKIVLNDIENILVNTFSDNVASIRLSGLGGVENYQVLRLPNGHERLSLKKRLFAQEDGSLIARADISFNYVEDKL